MSGCEPALSGHRSGDTIDGKYELRELAGEGSTGEVWLATNTTLDMPVALKLLRRRGTPRRHGAPTLGERFDPNLLREAQATARVTHPSIVRVFDFGVSEAGDPFIVMERLDGEDLRDRLLRDGPCPLVHAVQLVLPVIHAMHAAHVRGIVHRDLKPENIYLSVDDSGRTLPKVVDFGIADLPWEREDRLVVGTPAYMAPEQAAGAARSDFRADIYSLTVVLYELIAGYTPASYRNWPDRPNPESAPDDDGLGCLVHEGTIDAPLAAIMGRGLMRHPAARHRSMRELGEALAQWLLDRGVDEDVQGVLLSSNWLCGSIGQRAEPVLAHRTLSAGERAATVSPRPRSALGRTVLLAAPLALLAAVGAVGVAFAARPRPQPSAAAAQQATLAAGRLEHDLEPPRGPDSRTTALALRASAAATATAAQALGQARAQSPKPRVGATSVEPLVQGDTRRRANPPLVLAIAPRTRGATRAPPNASASPAGSVTVATADARVAPVLEDQPGATDR